MIVIRNNLYNGIERHMTLRHLNQFQDAISEYLKLARLIHDYMEFDTTKKVKQFFWPSYSVYRNTVTYLTVPHYELRQIGPCNWLS